MVVATPAYITKVLLPQRRGDVLRRPRLLDFLHQHIDRRLILCAAPPGYGKTTLLVDFARDVAIPVCWYSLGPEDADVRVFLEYLIASIRQRFPQFGKETEAALARATDLQKELSAIVGVLVSEMYTTIPEYFIVVLDDFHSVDGSDQIKTILDLLLYYLPENCHIVIVSRTIPRITLTRLTAHRQVSGLGSSDLRFTADEIKQLLSENYKVLLPVKTAEALATETEGWITGIILSTHTMWQGLFEAIIRAKGAGGEVFDYLASEVFDQQAEDVQRFLLASSVLEHLRADLCSALLPAEDAAAKLAHLENANLFVTSLEGSAGWYRYHQLFRNFLESKLRNDHLDWYVSLQTKAAELAVERSSWDEAIGHHSRAGNFERAVDIIVSHAEAMIDTGRQQTLARWIDSLPEEIMASRPELLLIRGRIHRKSGELERSLEVLTQAHAHFIERGDHLNMARTLTTRSIALAIKGRYGEAIHDCDRAISLADASDHKLVAEIYRNLGICHGMQGHFPEAIEALSEALRLHRDTGDQYATATLHQSLGMANAKLGDIPRARFHFDQALSVWPRVGNPGAWAETLNSLGVLLFDDGDIEGALATLGQALAKARDGNYLRTEAFVLADIGDIYRTQQRFAEAIEHYERSLEIARRVEEGFLIGYDLSGLGDTYARTGEVRKADRLIRQAVLQAEERQSAYELGIYETSLGMLRCDQGQPAKGLRSFLRACEFLEQCGAKRELTRALTGRARALLQMNHAPEAIAQFQAALNLGTEIEHEQFLLRDGKRVLDLLELALREGLADPRIQTAIVALRGMVDSAKPTPSLALQPVARANLATLRALALGQARVLRENKEITRSGWASDKVRELFFFLLDHSYSLTKEQIVESLWPDLPHGSYNSTFHSTMYRLRRALQGEYLVQREGRYRLSPDLEYYYDVSEFERLIDEAERLPKDSLETVDKYRSAAALYKGPYLKEFEAEWCEPRRRRLNNKYLSAVTKLAAAALGNGEYDQGVELCQRVLAEDNFREDAHDLLLKCFVALDNHTAALRHYRQYANFLRDELGVAPSTRIQTIYDLIIKGDSVPSPHR